MTRANEALRREGVLFSGHIVDTLSAAKNPAFHLTKNP
jgi:hypothetical protein